MSKTNAKILLCSVFVARGTSFLFSKQLMDSMSPMSVLAVRFISAFLVLVLIFNRKMIKCDRAALSGGLKLGVMYTVCMAFEMYGLRLIDSGVSSLIENMAIVFVPVFIAIAGKTLPQKKTMLCAVSAVIGVGFLSVTQLNISGGGLGIILTLFAAMSYAVCIILTEKVSRDGDPITIGIIQLGTMGVLSLIVSLLSGSFSMPQTGSQWGMLLLLVLLCSCFGFTFQPVGQKYLAAETAAVFTVVNPLTASIMGVAVGGESFSFMKAAGYVLILGALVLYNINPKKEK